MAARNFGKVNVSISASTGGLTAGLSNASKQLRGFGGITGGITGTLRSAAASFLGMGRAASFAAIGVRALTLAVSTLLGPLLVLTSAIAIFRMFARAAQDLDKAGEAAQRLGMSMQTFQAFSRLAQESGLSAEQASSLFARMQRQVGSLAIGSRSATAAFATLGLSFADLQGLSPEQQFELISQRIMALPPGFQRTSAAIAIFGRSGAEALNLIQEVSNGALTEIQRLQKALGVSLTDRQTAGIMMMNDALSRAGMVLEGFINQFLAELAPAITTVANLFVRFFAENTSGFSIATTMAQTFSSALRYIVGAVTVATGAFQIMYGVGALIGQVFASAFAVILDGLRVLMRSLASLAKAAGFTNLAADMQAGAQGIAQVQSGAQQLADSYGQSAAEAFANGINNITNPFAAFDAEMASVQQQMTEAGAAAGQTMGATAAAQIQASTKDLSAIVVGTAEGEKFVNALKRGADPRLEGDKAAQRTADNTDEMVDQLDELNGALAASGGFGVATIGV